MNVVPNSYGFTCIAYYTQGEVSRRIWLKDIIFAVFDVSLCR